MTSSHSCYAAPRKLQKQNCFCARYKITMKLVQFLACGDRNTHTFLVSTVNKNGRSQLPSGLWRGSMAARLLRLWVRILEGNGCLSIVSVVCCQVEASATSWSLVQRSPTDLACVIEKPEAWGGPAPRWAAAPHERKKKLIRTRLTKRAA
jgi:hypothetical protein